MDELKKLEEILRKIEAYETLGGNVPTTKEVAEAFALLMETMKTLHEKHIEQMSEVESEMGEQEKEMRSEMDAQMTKMEEMCEEMTKAHGDEQKEMKAELMAEIKKVVEMMPQMPDLSDLEKRVGDFEKKEVKTEHLATIESLEKLKEEIEKEIKELKARPVGARSVFGARGLQLYTNGTKRGMAQMVNIIPGIGVSLSYDYANGRNDITINASASTSVLTATGTINDSNTTFTFASEPAILIINGASYQQTGGAITWTWTAGTLTVALSSPVGSGGSIFGLA